jgi:hypothetical protein
MTETVPIGAGDDLDVAAGRCCPTCRHDLTPHNVEVWNAGYSTARRHLSDELREAWDAGFTAYFTEHQKQALDPSYPISRPNPFGRGR